MAVYTWYLTNNSVSNGSDLSTSDPGAEAFRSPVTGWIVSTGSTNRAEWFNDVERAATTFSGTTVPDGTLDTTNGDFWTSPTALTGTFAAGNWTVKFGARANTGGDTHSGLMYCRLFKGPNQDGSSATEITGAAQAGSAVTNLLTSATQVSTATFDPGAITLTNEYIFVQIAWGRTGAAGMTTYDVNARIGGASGSQVVTTNFTPPTVLYWIVQADATATPTAAQIVAGQDGTGAAALKSGSETYTTGGTYDEATAITGLTPGTAYEQAWVAHDGSTYSNVATTTITTVANLNLAQTANIALTGVASVSGDVQIGTSFNLAQTANVALTGVASVAGDIQIQSGALDLTQTANIELSGVAAVSGDVQIGASFNLAQTANVALSGTTAVSGDVQFLTAALDLAQTANIALTGVASISGDVQIGTSFNLAQTANVALTGVASVSGDVQIGVGLDLAQTNIVALAGVLGISGDVQFSFDPVAVPSKGAGKSRKPRRRKYQVEVDGEVFEVASLDEAQEVLERVKEDAEKTAAVAIERATKAKRRPVRKVIADARKALQLPQIAVSSPDISAMANQMLGQIRANYDSALHAIEIAAHMARRDREIEEDDEEVMLLL